MRSRALIALLSTELFGIVLPLPSFPTLKSIRMIGMSDPPEQAERLAAKFDYTNTFYHQAPRLDVTEPNTGDLGRYDVILSSEVMEHVPPPVERAFENLYRMLKPDGLLLLTTPYSLWPETKEHYAELHEYALASVGDKLVLVNRRRDGSVEVFENLAFHGGHGSTLEMRVFNEETLRGVLAEAGFECLRFSAECWPEFGVEHAETWSLPIAARKGRFAAPVSEVAQAYRDALRGAADLKAELSSVRADYDRFIEFHNTSHKDLERQLQERYEWVRKVEADLEERTRWALKLQGENAAASAELVRLAGVDAEREKLERELAEARSSLAALRSRLWTRIGRKAGMVE